MNPRLPCLLLVEDDPVSAAFLRDAAAALPARVVGAGTLAEAMAEATATRFDLWLVDANLPDGRGEALLQALRARGDAPPALAHTAAADAPMRERLLAAGFADVLCKPIGVPDLHAALRLHLPGTLGAPIWDDEAARASLGGEQAHVDALRALFLQELPGQRERIRAAAATGDPAAMRDELHRLVASCGFVGAARLAEAVRALQAAPGDAEQLQRFDVAAGDLLGE